MAKRWMLCVALAAALIPVGYAGQAVCKLKRALGNPASLDACNFEFTCEPCRALGMSLPLPQVSCEFAAQEFLWSPGRNAWVKVLHTSS